MARGETWGGEIKEKARALLVVKNASAVAKELNLPYSTVKTWEKECSKKSEKENEKSLEELRNEKKRAFVASAWELIEKTENILVRRVERATNSEETLDEIVEIVADEALSADKKKMLINKLSLVRLESVKELAVLLGTLYDKQALASKECTLVIGEEIKKFEDFEE